MCRGKTLNFTAAGLQWLFSRFRCYFRVKQEFGNEHVTALFATVRDGCTLARALRDACVLRFWAYLGQNCGCVTFLIEKGWCATRIRHICDT